MLTQGGPPKFLFGLWSVVLPLHGTLTTLGVLFYCDGANLFGVLWGLGGTRLLVGYLFASLNLYLFGG